MAVPIILASTSAIRAELLTRAGLEFTAQPPRVDETALKDSLIDSQTPARDVADALAEMKALRVSGRTPAAFVIGADQVLEADGLLLSKPETRDAAEVQLRGLRGKAHRLHSAVVCAEAGKPVWRHVATATLHVRPFSDDFLEEYLDTAWPAIAHCVGSYRLEAEGVRLFSRIDGDYFTILGLPLLPLLSYLTTRGILRP